MKLQCPWKRPGTRLVAGREIQTLRLVDVISMCESGSYALRIWLNYYVPAHGNEWRKTSFGPTMSVSLAFFCKTRTQWAERALRGWYRVRVSQKTV